MHRCTDLQALSSGGSCLGTWRGLEYGMADEELAEEEAAEEAMTVTGHVYAAMKRVGSEKNIAR